MRLVGSILAGAVIALAMVFGGFAVPEVAQAQIDDHLKCYKVRDAQSLKGIVDITTLQFGLEPGCTISRTQFFCVPGTKHVQEAAVNRVPIDPLPIVGPPAPGDRICYKISCPKPFPPDQEVTDQFGNRILSSLTPSLLCTPAVKGSAFCGDGEVNRPDEECDDGNHDDGDGCSSECLREGEVCGGIAGIPCPDRQFCEFPEGTCSVADLFGTCREIPDTCICTFEFIPVCGCDGVTYSNDCSRRCAGTSLAHQGECDPF